MFSPIFIRTHHRRYRQFLKPSRLFKVNLKLIPHFLFFAQFTGTVLGTSFSTEFIYLK
jgi:hypothetical protein